MELQYLQLYQRHASLEVLFKIFAQICSAVINVCFSENLLVAAAYRFKVLKLFISLKVTVYIQYRRLRSKKALEGQSFKQKSNCTEMAKYTCDYKHKIQCNIYIYIYIQQNLAKQFTLHPAEAYSEPLPTSKQGCYLIGGNYFHKNSILDV